jgi:hypothetical protein
MKFSAIISTKDNLVQQYSICVDRFNRDFKWNHLSTEITNFVEDY